MERDFFKHREHPQDYVRRHAKRVSELEKQCFEIEKWAVAGQIAARAAHEINNPLAGIKNSFLLIKDAISKNHPYYRYVGLIEDELNRVTRIVHHIFDLYRPDQDITREFHLDRTIADIIELLDSSRRTQGVTIAVDINSKTITNISESSLKQVLYNVILNAIEVSPMGGTIGIESKTEGGTLTLSISDQGEGVPEELRHRIFEPFATTKTGTNGGLGLGLSVSKEIVEGLGGSLEFDSKRDGGTVFRIIIPLNAEGAKEVAENEISGANFTGR